MRLRINLRGDLTKLSDEALADRLKANWAIYEAAGVTPPGPFSINVPLSYSFRGTLRHPRAYRFWSALVNSNIWWLSLLLTTLLSSPRMERFLRFDRRTDAHLSLCEIRDIMDEVECRVKQKQRKS